MSRRPGPVLLHDGLHEYRGDHPDGDDVRTVAVEQFLPLWAVCGVPFGIFGCWAWGGGWLAQLGVKAGLGHGYVDFAGSGVVHLMGGIMG